MWGNGEQKGDILYSVSNIIFYNKIGKKTTNLLGRNENFHSSAEFLTLFRMGFFGVAHGWGEPF